MGLGSCYLSAMRPASSFFIPESSWGLCTVTRLRVYIAFTRTVQEPQATIYGKRDGALHGIAVISGQDKHNLMKQTRGWKQGVIHGVSMLPRNEMWKPDSVTWIHLEISLGMDPKT